MIKFAITLIFVAGLLFGGYTVYVAFTGDGSVAESAGEFVDGKAKAVSGTAKAKATGAVESVKAGAVARIDGVKAAAKEKFKK